MHADRRRAVQGGAPPVSIRSGAPLDDDDKNHAHPNRHAMTDSQRRMVLYAMIAAILFAIFFLCVIVSAIVPTNTPGFFQSPDSTVKPIQLGDEFRGGLANTEFTVYTRSRALVHVQSDSVHDCASRCAALHECVAIEYDERAKVCLAVPIGYQTQQKKGTMVYMRKLNGGADRRKLGAAPTVGKLVSNRYHELVFVLLASEGSEFGSRLEAALTTWLADETVVVALENTEAAHTAVASALRLPKLDKAVHRNLANPFNRSGSLVLEFLDVPQDSDVRGAHGHPWMTLETLIRLPDMFTNAAWFVIIADDTVLIPSNLRTTLAHTVQDHTGLPAVVVGQTVPAGPGSVEMPSADEPYFDGRPGIAISRAVFDVVSTSMFKACMNTCKQFSGSMRLSCCVFKHRVAPANVSAFHAKSFRTLVTKPPVGELLPVSFGGMETGAAVAEFVESVWPACNPKDVSSKCMKRLGDRSWAQITAQWQSMNRTDIASRA